MTQQIQAQQILGISIYPMLTPKWSVGTVLYDYLNGSWYKYVIESIDTSYPATVFYYGTLTNLNTSETWYNQQATQQYFDEVGASTTPPLDITKPPGEQQLTPSFDVGALLAAIMPFVMLTLVMQVITPMTKGLVKSKD